MTNILRIDASARYQGSTTRALAEKLVERLLAESYGAKVVHRDLAATPPALLDESWVFANFTDEAERSDDQKTSLAGSDALIAELEAADTIVIGVPVYNFAIPAALKAWVDQIARARKTFRYTEAGPEGLLKGKRAFLVVASGGVPVGSDYDFATGYLRHVLGFVGITDVTIIAADQQMADETAVTRATAAIDGLQQAA
ncbi:NAD(P)H-dependent oxidoreductase [Sphingopyxis sp. XHP0097]|jgi:FMN-dependent NADH-azoreductase|uniref:FMN dependent NADH:quinone oxidoreductase n=1 Tax=Sphingopyxis jiangsuensis TaxID=2871171 RepID=A0ABS7M9W5_9SPHN|nr:MULTISPECIES: NAD(P)H-dependent oxidoreductase [Sphingopyxis]MBL0768469.1 NAD(P)H-dependent oxidoreductase [Sphingopyxis lutea]MBY4635816.1 NAD(P)H-dependent oxidoreductase [Sphingopyxis jiangsuensis]